MGGVLFPDRSGGSVHLQYLLWVEDWQRAGRFTWGASVLSYMYREMGRSVLQMTQSSSLGGDLGGWSALLQTCQHGDQFYQYKLWFDEKTIFVWRPYFERAQDLSGSVIQSDMFRAVVPLICFSSAMWHHPDCVLEQFGMMQDEPHQPHPVADIRFFLRQGQHGPSSGQ
ncbi:unnamed protein product [Linum tenue]|uniref:Aminotransferase-like plant mobile domain-containing protein n=1 Tax=Linum tenue TaxID=586396 RepID=A0AAV0L9N2_9ROSI|nr:unnamed protein product [Linum tenue]